MTGSEMADQLEKVAEGARNGNSACLAVAREMLTHRRMLLALSALEYHLAGEPEATRKRLADYRTAARDAIAAAKGE